MHILPYVFYKKAEKCFCASRLFPSSFSNSNSCVALKYFCLGAELYVKWHCALL